MRRRPLSCFCLLLILLIFLGTVTGMTGRTDKEWDEKGCTLTGRVYDKEWVTGEEEKKIVYLEILEADNASGMEDAEGKKVLCYLKQGQELPKLGSYIRITGKIRNFRKASNPGQFDARSYYRISGIAFQINQVIIQQKSEQYQKGKEALFQLRKGLSETFDRQLSPENASLMKTMVLGEKKALDREIKKRYQRNGIAHLLAISGLHISLIGMAFYKVLRKTAQPVSFCAGGAVLFMYGYGCMAGFSVSSRRALIMFGVQMAAVMFGRTYDLLTSVSLAALLILAEQPWYFYSSSFLFSFGCVLAIGLLVPAMTCKKTEALSQSDGKKKAAAVVRQYGIFWKLLEGLRKWLLPGCAISAAGLPLQLCFYYQMPVYVTFLNLLVIPLMSFLLPCGLLLILVERAEILAIPFSFVITGILGIYESACLVVETPYGQNYVVDCGSTSENAVGEYRLIPFLKYQGIGTVDGVIMTHADEDHISGIRELLILGKEEGIQVKALLLPDISEESRDEAYQELAVLAEENQVPVEYIYEGEAGKDREFQMNCIHPERGLYTSDNNSYSTVLLMEYQGRSLLLTGDIEGEEEVKMTEELATQIDVLKVAHHGSRNSTGKEVLSVMKPKAAVISCGKDNFYGHPHAETLERLSEAGTRWFCTRDYGAVTVTVNRRGKLEIEGYLERE